MTTRVDLAVAARPELVRYALRLTGNAADAEDVVHDAYVRVLPILGSLDGDAAVVRVLYRTVLNRTRDVARRRKLLWMNPLPDRWAGLDGGRGDDNPDGDGAVPAALVDHDSPDVLVLRAERQRLVRAVLTGLPVIDQDALYGRHWRNAPWYRTDATGKSRLLRARRRFRAEWEQVA